MVNESTVLTDYQVQSPLPALKTQAHRDFAAGWGDRNTPSEFYAAMLMPLDFFKLLGARIFITGTLSALFFQENVSCLKRCRMLS